VVSSYPVNKCDCDKLNITCNHVHQNLTNSSTETYPFYVNEEEMKRETAKKLEKLEKRREIEKSQPWKHKNKPKY